MAYWQGKRFSLLLGERTYVMGILNITPDSFSDGGDFLDPETAVAHALELEAQGADLIDIGPQSTRPGHASVSPAEEIQRLSPVLGRISAAVRVPVSVDTFYPETAAFALEGGAAVVNDVSGAVSPEMARVVRDWGAGWVIMHNGPGEPAEIADWLLSAAKRAEEMGVLREGICLDPGAGAGFGKTYEQNLRIIRDFRAPEGYPYLAGFSRKSFIGAAAGEPAPKRREAGTIAAHVIAVMGGADVIRTHDAAAGIQSVRVADAVKGA